MSICGTQIWENMNVILVDENEISAGKVQFSDHRAKHIIKVLNSEVGDSIRLGIINGKLGIGKITDIKRKFPFQVAMDTTFNTDPPEKTPVDLLLALPRPIMLKRIFSQATSLGIETIHIINANRVEKSFWEAGVLHSQENRQHLIQGLEQAVDTVLPKIVIHKRFKPFIEDYFPDISEKYSHLIFAHPKSRLNLYEMITAQSGRILLAIGPEGGWVDYEVDRFCESGFTGFTIGERILKVDTAVINIHGRLMENFERFQPHKAIV